MILFFETIACPRSEDESYGAARSLATRLYSLLFGWLVRRTNRALAPRQRLPLSAEGISLLDIFGFESFARNSLEQLCINYANEALQQQFNKETFKASADECIAEL